VIGVLVLSHYRLADEFVAALRHIVGEVPHVRAMGVDPASTAPEEMRAQIDKAIREVDQGKGVLVLVDMFGGTPSNLSLSFLDEGRVEVVTGVNLPMLVKVARQKSETGIHALAELARDYGRRNISVASDLLSSREPAKSAP
jgi:PTS system mannose-specific IIA component